MCASNKLLLSALLVTALTPATVWAQGTPASEAGKEQNCTDRVDNDGDSLIDCLDSDCYNTEQCKTSGGPENTNLLCDDGIDNDGDGVKDCQDKDCHAFGVTVCQGSWKGPLSGTGVEKKSGGGKKMATSGNMSMPKLGEGMSVEDLIGTGSDIDGERNNQVCSDGYDNDGDGMTDCEDFGCRFDPQVNVCQAQVSGIRFSVWANVMTSYNFEAANTDRDPAMDTRFNRVQLRAFGEIPLLENSFFLLSMRAERTPRLSFLLLQVPLGGGHRLAFNSGGGGLSNALVLSTHKNPLLDRPFYLYNAFEGGNGAAVEVSGPLVQGLLEYKAFVAGGRGNFNGNVGGRFFNNDRANFTWGAGGQVGFFPIGRFDRWDSRFIYTPATMGLSMYLGARFDQKPDEQFAAVNFATMFRWKRIVAAAEGWGKREFDFEAWQFSWNLMGGFLVIPKWLMVAADYGQFYPLDYESAAELPTELQRQTDETMWRIAAHLYLWRTNGVLSLLYTDHFTESYRTDVEDEQVRELRLEARFGF